MLRSRSDPEALSRSLSSPELLLCSLSSPELLLGSLSEPWSLSPALPGRREGPLSTDADRSFLPALSVPQGRSPSEMLVETNWSEVELVFSGPEGGLSEAADSVLPFLPRSLFNLILLWVIGFT